MRLARKILQTIRERISPFSERAVTENGNLTPFLLLLTLKTTSQPDTRVEIILNSRKEKDYFRGDALQAIYQIDEAKGMKLAKRYRQRKDCLRKIAHAVLNKEKWLKEDTDKGD